MRKKIFAMLLVFTLILVSISSVVSAYSLEIGMTNDKLLEDAKPGDEVKVTLSLSNIDKGDTDGTNAIKGELIYDPAVLTYVGYTTLNGWTRQGNTTTASPFVFTNGDYISTNQDFAIFTFKINSNTTATSTKVTATSLATNFVPSAAPENAQDVDAEEAYTKITINIPSVTPTPSSEEETPTPEVPNTLPKVTKEVVTSGTSDDKTLPQTGISDVILPAIGILSAISVVSYISYKKYKNI